MSNRKYIIRVLKRINKDSSMLSKYAKKPHMQEEIIDYCMITNKRSRKDIQFAKRQIVRDHMINCICNGIDYGAGEIDAFKLRQF